MPPARGSTWAAWVTGTCPSLGRGGSPVYPPLLLEMWLPCLWADPCRLPRSTDAHAGEKTPHEFTCARSTGGSFLVAAHTASPRAACRLPVAFGRQPWQARAAPWDGSRAISGSNKQGLTAAVFAPAYVWLATNFPTSFVLLFRLISPLFQKSLCNSPGAVQSGWRLSSSLTWPALNVLSFFSMDQFGANGLQIVLCIRYVHTLLHSHFNRWCHPGWCQGWTMQAPPQHPHLLNECC